VEAVDRRVHSVLERIEVMTNPKDRPRLRPGHQRLSQDAQGWRMVVHHASPGTQSEQQEISERAQVLH
jgi:hypothetical protein